MILCKRNGGLVSGCIYGYGYGHGVFFVLVLACISKCK